jgi:glycerophosphoryl diester phosphodiesterase
MAVHNLDASLMLGLLVDKASPDSVKTAVGVGARQLCPSVPLATPEFVKKTHESDLLVAAWTANTPQDMRAVMSAGADGIMTDFPDRLRATIEDAVASA